MVTAELLTSIFVTSSAYGARFDANRLFYQYDPVTQGRASVATPWVAYKNNRKDLFQTGYTLTNSVALTGKSDRGSVRASITHTKNEWILPNTGFQRITAMVSAQQQISRALRINFKLPADLCGSDRHDSVSDHPVDYSSGRRFCVPAVLLFDFVILLCRVRYLYGCSADEIPV